MLKLISVFDFERKPSESFDVFIAACGYEGRATAASSKFHHGARRKLAIGFSCQRDLEYGANKAWFERSGFDLIEVSDEEFRDELESYLFQTSPDGQGLNLEIDISCFNRFRLAQIVDILRRLGVAEVIVTFHYSIAEFTPPIKDSAPTLTVAPVIPQFAGWTTRPDRPPAAIVGLGYEPNKAIGIVDHLEINNATWAYYPLGPVPEYYQRVLEANKSLVEIIQSDGRCQAYDLKEPVQLFGDINSLVDMLKPYFNAVLIPFGPKLFALVTLLVACVHEEVGVWRVSSGALEDPVNRKPSGHVVSVVAKFEAS